MSEQHFRLVEHEACGYRWWGSTDCGLPPTCLSCGADDPGGSAEPGERLTEVVARAMYQVASTYEKRQPWDVAPDAARSLWRNRAHSFLESDHGTET